MAWLRRSPKPGDAPVDLRSRLLELDPADVGLAPTAAHPNVWCALMEMGFPDGAATIVSLADGSTSMYTSEGGGVIGGGEHERVAQASMRFIAAVETRLGELEPDVSDELPGADLVTFRALTYSSRRAATASEDELASAGHPLSPLFDAGHEVITALRETEEAGR
jgi:hypothetical protein